MLRNGPEFSRIVPQHPETIYVVPEGLFDDIVRQEADRILHPDLVQNRTVYDSVEVNTDERTGVGAAGLTAPRVSGIVDELPPYYTPCGPDDHTLVFESRFESGNLRRAVRVYEYEYDLILNPDYNTKAYTQWYLFRVGNTRPGPSYRFNIINMEKPTSMYNEGMRPLWYSEREISISGTGWVRCGTQIAYYQNGIRRKDKGSNYYTLTFTVQFNHHDDQVYFAHCYPYTYTDLQKDLLLMEQDPAMARRFRRRKLCETLAGNACDLVTITSFTDDLAALRSRRAVVITARVHPGESNASWVMKGMLDYLTGASLDARILRDNFVFKIMPMLNPDGVVVGNYRCSLAGMDLNRQWSDPSRKLHPTIFFCKSMMRHLMDDREVILYIDIHGHSRKRNVFMYGNTMLNTANTSLREKVFPRLLSKSSDCFNFNDCCFKVQKGKESTARVVVYREMDVINSFTLEASFCGADFGPLADQHFTRRHFEEMGYMVCDAILDFCDPDQSKVMFVLKELQTLFPDDGASDDVSDSGNEDNAAAKRRKKLRKQALERKAKAKAAKLRKAERERATAADPGSDAEARDHGRSRAERQNRRESRRRGDAEHNDICTSDAEGGPGRAASRRMPSVEPEASAGGRRASQKKKRLKEKSNTRQNAEATVSSALQAAAATTMALASGAPAARGESGASGPSHAAITRSHSEVRHSTGGRKNADKNDDEDAPPAAGGGRRKKNSKVDTSAKPGYRSGTDSPRGSNGGGGAGVYSSQNSGGYQNVRTLC
eukprot:gnl/TRDRNA2_/TRDRNA2_153809_c1_seq1.p1 gnl/TRDRNA2_/TRDRNA2_153809_c1~~gnl/TRDRNA2_/TRDRNA2_153809_c1_seq1.p1  ORF type:complete len:878 (-),score=143.06 gnl/TRDRNA2_/TRDRNA2_153809_c1_seq1:50-2368(-)